MRISSIVLACVLGVALFAPRPVAANSPPRPPTAALDMIRDMRLTVLVRRALAEDEKLSRYRLGVEVRGGVAKLWGEVPSSAIEELVKSKVDAIAGIHGVRSELIVGTTKLDIADQTPIPARVPARIVVESAKPDPDTGTIRKRNSAVVVGGEVPRAVKPGNLPTGTALPRKEESERAVLRAPTVVRRETPPPRARDEPRSKPSLADAVAKVKSSQDRFRTIAVEIDGDSVIISRAGADGSAVTAFREAIRRVKGVGEVIVTSD